MNLRDQITKGIATSEDKIAFIESLRELLHELSPLNGQPIDRVRWVPIGKVEPNDYNPNSVAKVEMSLLHTSIDHDGYTQPIVTIYDDARDKYVIVDGFHRYFTAKTNKDILERNLGMVPVTVIAKDINDRMASTVRHNRARGKHSIKGMSAMVFSMLDNGWADEDICNELGMEPEELLKLKYITGFAKLFEDTDYNKAWETKRQIQEKKKFRDSQKS